MLRLDVLPDKTRALFEYLRADAQFRELKMSLYGGTALALLIGHRRSEDLDFFSFEATLPKFALANQLTRMRAAGFHVVNSMDLVRISQARINGILLEDFIQEFTINGVKVSFGTWNKGNPARRQHFSQAPVITDTSTSFHIPTLQTLFESKAVVLMDRIMSRDLFDLMVLVKHHGYTLNDIIHAIMHIDGRDQNEALSALEILVGNIPADPTDPGFASIAAHADLKDIHAFFREHVNQYERQLALQAVGRN